MVNKKVADLVREIAEPICSSLGYELVEVEYAKKSTGMTLTLFIYNEMGINLDDCEKVSKALDEPLEKLDPTDGDSYIFNVSSLGLDWPIKNKKDILRNLNQKVEIKLYAPYERRKIYQGVLIGGDDEEVKFYEINDKLQQEKTFKFKDIAKMSKLIEF